MGSATAVAGAQTSTGARGDAEHTLLPAQQPETANAAQQAAGVQAIANVLDDGGRQGEAPLDFVAKDKKVAVVIGPDIMNDEHALGGMLEGDALRVQRERPDATLIDYKHLGAGSLAHYDSVVLIAHGAPGRTMWGAPKVVNEEGEKKLPGYEELSADQLTALMRKAGFKGTHVLLESCNGGTDTSVHRAVGSTAAALASGLHTEVLAARADDKWKAYAINKETIFELLQTGSPRIATSDDVGAVILDKEKTRIIAEVTRADLGNDLASRYPDLYLANEATGTVLSTGDMASDIDGGEPMVTRVPHGHWVVYAPDGSRRVYTK